MTCIANPAPLAPPTLEYTHRNGINISAAAKLWIEVQPYPGMDSADVIELFWEGCYVASCVLKAEDVGNPVQLRVPESFIVSGEAQVHYRLMQVGRQPALSASTTVQIKLDCPGGHFLPGGEEENQNLRPVILPDVIARRGVNSHQIRRGVPLSIEPYPNMAEGDEITLRWGDVRMDLPPISPEDVGRAINVWVPSAMIVEAGEDLRVDVTYCILDRVGNNSRWAPPRRVKVGYANPCLKVPVKGLPMDVQVHRK